MSGRFDGKRVLVTGGLGFVGSSTALALAAEGAEVSVADNLLPGGGGNLFNVEPRPERLEVVRADVRDQKAMDELVEGRDYVFHMAAHVSHVRGLSDPFPDLDVNVKGTATVLEACRRRAPKAVVVRAGTRGQYGAALSTVPISEDAPMNPRGVHELSQLTAERLMLNYHRSHGMACVSLRATNLYGPRGQMLSDESGVANWFVRLALEDRDIPLYGGGTNLRDFLYVDDAVSAILAAALAPAARGRAFNVASGRPASFRDFASALIEAAGGGRIVDVPFTRARASSEPGDFRCDIARIKAAAGWEPRTSLEEGLRRTVAYYRENAGSYWTGPLSPAEPSRA